eukprot:1162018-Pelagomonas_calceolata.AAC.17
MAFFQHPRASQASTEACKTIVRDELFTSPAFARFLNAITTITMIGQRGEVRRFRPGRAVEKVEGNLKARRCSSSNGVLLTLGFTEDECKKKPCCA